MAMTSTMMVGGEHSTKENDDEDGEDNKDENDTDENDGAGQSCTGSSIMEEQL